MHNIVRNLFFSALGAVVVVGGRADASAQGSAREVVQLPPFHSIDVPKGGHVVLRRASTQRVSRVKGSQDYARFRVTEGGVLVIDVDRHKRPRGYREEIQIELPSVARLSLSNGGWIRTLGEFPRQGEIEVEVSNGGTIDTRSMPADRVTASVDQGGRILTVTGVALFATVSHGGVIIYWGNGRVTRSILDGGVVQKGEADDLTASL